MKVWEKVKEKLCLSIIKHEYCLKKNIDERWHVDPFLANTPIFTPWKHQNDLMSRRIYDNILQDHINPFHANVPFLYPLKTSENQRFSEVLREYRNGTLAWKGFLS